MRMLALLQCAVLLCVGVSGVAAQEPGAAKTPPSADVLARWLHGGDPRQQAWAAADAVALQDVSLIPDMVQLAEDWSPLQTRPGDSSATRQTELARKDAMANILDAIIQMDGALPPDAIRSLAQDFPAQSITLLARMAPESASPVLLSMFQDAGTRSDIERATAAMLALHPVNGFASRLLRDMTIVTYVFVSLGNDQGLAAGAFSHCGAGFFEPGELSGWPSLARYSFRDARPDHSTNVVLTIPGLKPIQVLRSAEPASSPRSYSDGDLEPLNSELRLTLLAQMLHETPTDLPLRAQQSENIHAETEAAYNSQLAVYVTAMEAHFVEMQNSLAAAQVMTASEAGSIANLPHLLLQVTDIRSAKPFPLRQTRFAYPNVEEKGWSSTTFEQ